MEGAKILLDTYRDHTKQWCWREGWHVHGESAWTLLWKFSQLNQLTARELAAVITNRTSGRRTAICAKPDVDLRDASAFDLDLLAKMFRVQPATVRRAFLYEILPGSVLRSHDHLRWCDQCLYRGFHSPLFQMRLTRTCPIHGHPLRDVCRSCGRQIPYRLNNSFVLAPFHCPHCDFDFAPPMSEDRPQMLQLNQEHISNLSWLLKFHRAADVDLITVNDAERLFTSARKVGIFHVNVDEVNVQDRYASFIAQIVHEVAPGQYSQPSGLRLNPMERYVNGCSRPTMSNDDEEDDEFVQSDTGVEDSTVVSQICLAAIVDTYKAIRRRLWQRVLKKHQCCIRYAAARMSWRMDGKRTGGFCPHALAFIRWRMLWEGCGTPRYLLVRPANDYFSIIGWHLARPCPVPDHWSTPTKAWIASHIFGATCLAAFDEILKWAESACAADLVRWDRAKSPIDYTCLWAVGGRDCRDQPAVVYLRRSKTTSLHVHHIKNRAAHWLHLQADIGRLEQTRFGAPTTTQRRPTYDIRLPPASTHYQHHLHDRAGTPASRDRLSLFVRLFADGMRLGS